MVTIIPKAPQKTPLWQPFLLYFSVGLIIVVVAAYLILTSFEDKAVRDIEHLGKEITGVAEDEANKKIEEEVLTAKTKIEDFSLLLSHHRKTSQFFEFLESITHPEIGFLSLQLNPAAPYAELDGFAPDFRTVAQQMYILEKQELIEHIELASLSLGDRGEAAFTLKMALSPEVFK